MYATLIPWDRKRITDIIPICDSFSSPNSILNAVTVAPRGRTKKYTATRAKNVKDQDYGAREKFSILTM